MLLLAKKNLYLAVLFALMLTSLSAQAEQCNLITSLPITITDSGKYCLQSDLTYIQNRIPAIMISASNVTIDLNGWSLLGPYQDTPAGGWTTIAVRSTTMIRNITIKNGNITGFARGINMGPSRNINIENIKFRDTMVSAITLVRAESVTIKNNDVRIYNGNYTGSASVNIFNFIRTAGVNLLNNNVAVAVRSGGQLIRGVSSTQARNTIIDGNQFTLVNARTGPFTGIYYSGSTALVTNNTFNGFPTALHFHYAGGGVYRDNTVIGAHTPFTNGVDFGGNMP